MVWTMVFPQSLPTCQHICNQKPEPQSLLHITLHLGVRAQPVKQLTPVN